MYLVHHCHNNFYGLTACVGFNGPIKVICLSPSLYWSILQDTMAKLTFPYCTKAVFTRATFGLFVARHRDWRRQPTPKPLSRRLSAEVEHVPTLGKKWHRYLRGSQSAPSRWTPPDLFAAIANRSHFWRCLTPFVSSTGGMPTGMTCYLGQLDRLSLSVTVV